MSDTKLSLDLFRNNNLGYYICLIHYKDKKIALPFTYSDYYNRTLQIFMYELNQLENRKNLPIAYSPILLQIFTNFFACFEQFISILNIMLYFYIESDEIPTEKEAIKLFRQDYRDTLNAIFKNIEKNIVEFYRTGLKNKINELEDARNYILHGNLGRIKVLKTKLPDIPLTISYEEIMEELDIIINFIHFFRNVIPKIDLMPQVSIPVKGTILFKPLDEYFYNVLCPYMDLILDKHNFKSTKKYALFTQPIDSVTSNIVQRVDIQIKAEQNKFFNNIAMNNKNTNFYPIVLENFLDKNEVEILLETNTFQLPKFMRE